MKRVHVWIGALFGIAAAGNVLADVYEVQVTRIDQDLYKTPEGIYIETRYCYEYAYGEDAILKYEQYGYDNKLIFDSGTSCEVKGLFRH